MQMGPGSTLGLKGHPKAISAMPLSGHSLKEEAKQSMAAPCLSHELSTVNADQRPPHVRPRPCHPGPPPRPPHWVLLERRTGFNPAQTLTELSGHSTAKSLNLSEGQFLLQIKKKK